MKLKDELTIIRILGANCRIKYESNLDRGDNFGVFNPQNNLIQIANDSDITEVQKLSVVLHEVIEALNFKLELNLEHNQITGLETGLFQVLMDNPEFVGSFLEEWKRYLDGIKTTELLRALLRRLLLKPILRLPQKRSPLRKA